MKNNVLDKFFAGESKETRQARQQAVNEARSDSSRVKLNSTGHFLMECATFAYWKEDSNTKEKSLKTSPELIISEKKSLLLTINLRVVDGTPTVPQGASIYSNITLIPPDGATKDKIEKSFRMMKPRITALIGTDDIKIEPEWIDEWLIPQFEIDDDKIVLTKDHKMKRLVMVTVDEEVYMNKIKTSVMNIVPAKTGDKSVALKDLGAPEETKQNMADPAHSEFDESKKDEATSSVADIPLAAPLEDF